MTCEKHGGSGGSIYCKFCDAEFVEQMRPGPDERGWRCPDCRAEVLPRDFEQHSKDCPSR